MGKSFVAFLLALHHLHLREPVLCFDADATTATFSHFAALNVNSITLMEGTILNARHFVEMLEPILAEDAHCVVDTGTSSFVAVSHYPIENDMHEQFRLSGKKAVVHAIIVGGSTLKETLNDLYEFARQLPVEFDIVVWLNEHSGLIKQGDKTCWEARRVQATGPTGWSVPVYRLGPSSAAACSIISLSPAGPWSMVLQAGLASGLLLTPLPTVSVPRAG